MKVSRKIAMKLFNSLDKIKLINIEKYLKALENKNRTSIIFRSNGRIKQIDLYCFLKWKFGEPNGILSFLRGDHSNNFIQWHYSLNMDDIYIDIIGSTRFLEFHVFSENNTALDTFNEIEFLASLDSQISSNKKEINKNKNQLEYWKVFLNTYKRLKDTIEKFYQDYQRLTLQDPIQLKKSVVTKRELDMYEHQSKKLIENIIEKKNYGIVLKMLFPVLGESLINLIIFVLAKDEIKNDKRLLDNTFRNQIDIRIKTLHLNCIGMKKAYNQDDERFKNFLRLMDKRNDFLHGNILPANNTFDVVYFDKTVPIFEEEKDITLEYVKQNLFQITEEEINKDYQTIIQFRNYILDNISSPYKEQIELILDKSDLGWNKKNHRIGILFNNELMQAFLSTENEKDHV